MGARQHGTKLVLCIEDDVRRLGAIERIVRRRPNVRLTTATDGLRGTRLAREVTPDLVLLDLELDGMGGEEVLARLHADPATRRVPVVILSDDPSAALRDRLIARGAMTHLRRPIDAGELIEVLDQALSLPYSAAA